MIKHIATIKDKNGLSDNIIIEADSADFKALTGQAITKYGIRYKSAITGYYEVAEFDTLSAAKNALEYRLSIGSRGTLVSIKNGKINKL